MRLGAGSVLFLEGATCLRRARFCRASQAVGVERSRQQAIDRHAMTDRRARDAGHEAREARPRTVAEPQNVDRRLYRTRGDVHDAPEAALHHAVDTRLDELDGRQHVGVERLDPVLAVPVPEVARRRATRIVDDDVGLGTGCQYLLAAVLGRDVDGDRRHLHTILLPDLLRRRVEFRLGARVDDQIDALARQRHGAALAQSLARRADDGLAALDAHIHLRFPS